MSVIRKHIFYVNTVPPLCAVCCATTTTMAAKAKKRRARREEKKKKKNRSSVAGDVRDSPNAIYAENGWLDAPYSSFSIYYPISHIVLAVVHGEVMRMRAPHF